MQFITNSTYLEHFNAYEISLTSLRLCLLVGLVPETSRTVSWQHDSRVRCSFNWHHRDKWGAGAALQLIQLRQIGTSADIRNEMPAVATVRVRCAFRSTEAVLC